MADLKDNNQNLQKGQADKKGKWTEEKAQLEKELEESRTSYEGEINKLKDKLKQQKTTTSSDLEQQVTETEASLNKEWQEKCDRLVSAADAKHKRVLDEVKVDYKQLEEKVKMYEDKLGSLRSSTGENDLKVAALEEEVAELQLYKNKYDNLLEQATSMKQKYEAKISELQEHQGAAPAGGMDRDQLFTEVKHIMSSVYHNLKDDFEEQESYAGSDIKKTIMATIKSVTMQMMQPEEETEEGPAKIEGPEKVEVTRTTKEPDEPEIIGIVKAADIPVTGGRGNPYRAAELEKRAQTGEIVDEVTVATTVTSSGDNTHNTEELSKKVDALKGLIDKKSATETPSEDSANKSDATELDKDTELRIEEDIIVAAATPSGGDKGNKQYSAELDQEAANAKADGEPENEPFIEPVICVQAAPSTGKDGNPHYAEELNKASPPDDGPIIEETICAEAPPITGGRGNPYRAAELEQKAQAKEIVSEVITAAVATNSGGTGNPYYAAELDKKGSSEAEEKTQGDKHATVKQPETKEQTKSAEAKTDSKKDSSKDAKEDDSKKVEDAKKDGSKKVEDAKKDDSKKVEDAKKDDSKKVEDAKTDDSKKKEESKDSKKEDSKKEDSKDSKKDSKKDDSKKEDSKEDSKDSKKESPSKDSVSKPETVPSGGKTDVKDSGLFGSPGSDDSGDLFSAPKDTKKASPAAANGTPDSDDI